MGDHGIDRSGVELRVAMVDYNRTDEDGNPYMIQADTHFTNYELARTNQRQFVKHSVQLAARNILGEFRSETEDDDASL